ncbi:MAG: metallophosphoesterase [Lachnospiraceae bacterium]|nr:metallophosphoesterase [Lachnospiraceae bacterium]
MKTTIYDITEKCRGRIIAVSDVHGHGHYLKGLLEKISFSKEDTLVILGDLIEKGGDSLATVRYCMELQRQNFQIYISAGNVDIARIGTFLDRSRGHGKRFLDELRWTKDVWKCGFFLEVLAELGIELSKVNEENVNQLKERISVSYAQEIAFLCDRPTIITCGNYLFVHAGVPTDQLETLAGEDGFLFLKTDAFLEQKHCFERIVVVGHWPVCLYQRDVDCMNPVFDYDRHAIAIDGGCALKIGGQLNALIIPNPYASMQEIDTTSYDDYPVVYAKTAQKAVKATVCIKYYDAEVELLKTEWQEGIRDGNYAGSDIVTLRHKSSGVIFDAPEKYLYKRNDKLLCNDFINATLDVEAGC